MHFRNEECAKCIKCGLRDTQEDQEIVSWEDKRGRIAVCAGECLPEAEIDCV